MADTNKQTEILEIRVEVDQLKKQGQQAAQVLENLKKKQAELRKEGKAGSKQYQDNAENIRNVSSELRDINKTIDLNTKAQKAQKGSVEQLRRQLDLVTKQWKELSEEERENTKEGRELTRTKLDLTNKLKDLEKQTGDTRRNVGNYTESIREAIGQNAGFAGSIINVGKAFLANPIGAIIAAIVGALGLLYKAFTRNEEGSARIQKAMAYVSGTFNGLLKVLEPVANFLADKLVGAIEAPGDAINGLWESTKNFYGFLKDQFLRLIKETGTVFEELMAGNFKKAGEAALEAADALTNLFPPSLAIKTVAKGIADNYEQVAKTIGDTIDQAKALADAELALAKAQREQEKTQLRFQIQAERLRQVRDDESRQISERIDANEELGKVLKDQIQAETALAQRALDVARLRIQVEGRSKENLDALAEAELKLLEIQERVEAQASEQLTNRNALIKEGQDLKDEETKKAIETAKKIREVEKQILESKLDDNEKELQAIRDKYTNILIIIQESGASEVEMERLKKEALAAQDEELKNKKVEFQKEASEAAQAEAEKQAALREKLHQDEINGARTLNTQLKNLAQEGTAEAKALAITDTLVNTYASATAAFKALAGIPYVGPALGAAASAAAIASGLKNVSEISKARRGGVMKYARGGALGRGPGWNMYEAGGNLHSQGGTMYWGEDGNQFEVERGEILTVLNRNSSAMLKRLSDLNVAGGGVSFMKRGGVPIFQDGGVAAVAAGSSAQSQANHLRDTREILEALPPQFVSVAEFEAVQNRIKAVEARATAS